MVGGVATGLPGAGSWGTLRGTHLGTSGSPANRFRPDQGQFHSAVTTESSPFPPREWGHSRAGTGSRQRLSS